MIFEIKCYKCDSQMEIKSEKTEVNSDNTQIVCKFVVFCKKCADRIEEFEQIENGMKLSSEYDSDYEKDLPYE